MHKFRFIPLVICLIFVAGLLIHAAAGKLSSREPKKRYYPAAVDFAGEQAPLQIEDVRERFERELIVNANLDASTVLIMKRAARVFPVMEPILKQYGIPDDFKYLAVIESGLIHAVSPAGARGIWQFMPETAREYNLEVNEFVDERYHLEKSTVAACKYLLACKQKFGSWTLAAAAYNGGQGGVSKQIAFQGVENYYDLLLTEETARYVFRILALKEIMQNPLKYGFELGAEELYQPLSVRQLVVNYPVEDLAVFARSQGINYKILKIHNPWLRDRKLPNQSKRNYLVEIPTAGN